MPRRRPACSLIAAPLRSNTESAACAPTPSARARCAPARGSTGWSAIPGILQATSRFYPLGRVVETAEVANAALFLASPLASGITGVALPVDAGLTAGNLPFIRDIIERGK